MLLFVLLLIPGLVPESPRWMLLQPGEKAKQVMITMMMVMIMMIITMMVTMMIMMMMIMMTMITMITMIDKVIMDRIIPQGSEVLILAENENGRSGGGQIAATTSPKQVVSLF